MSVRRKSAPQPAQAPVRPADVVGRAEILRRLELDILGRIDGVLSGQHLAASTGPGSERSGARAYEPGDDARAIDWNLTARTQVPHIRTTDADREAETWVVADRSASMDFGTADREKREVVLAATAAFGLFGLRGRNRFGVVLVGGPQLERVPAAVGRPALFAALARLDATPRHAAGPPESATLAVALEELARTQQRRGQVVVLSDFLDASDWEHPLRMLALRHQVIAAQVTDPRELTLPPVGMLVAVDPESGRTLHVQSDSPKLRARYAAAAAERHAAIGRRIISSGADHLHLSTDSDWVLDTVTFALGRRARGRAVRIGTAALGGAR